MNIELSNAGRRVGDVTNLAEYDVVFLDIYGIIRDDLERGGLKLIAQLRAANRYQKICAVSSKTFDPTATEFFRQADDLQKKPMTSQVCQQVIDRLSREKLDPAHLATLLDNSLKAVAKYKRRALLRGLQQFARHSAADPSDFLQTDAWRAVRDDSIVTPLKDFIRILRHAA